MIGILVYILFDKLFYNYLDIDCNFDNKGVVFYFEVDENIYF